MGATKHQPLPHPPLLLWYLVAHTHFPAIPPAAGIGEVEHIIKIHIEIGLADDAEIAVVVFLPQVAVVVFRPGTAVHADVFYGDELAEFFQVVLEGDDGGVD